MIRVLGFIFSFIVGRYNALLKPSTLLIVDQILLKARKLMMNSMISLTSSLLLTGGILITLIEFTRQIDQFRVVWPSATLIGGFLLSILGVSALIYSFTAKTFDLRYASASNTKGQNPQGSSAHVPSPLEEALSLLVMDFVNERKQKRAHSQAVASDDRVGEPTKRNSNRSSSTEAESIYENTTLQ